MSTHLHTHTHIMVPIPSSLLSSLGYIAFKVLNGGIIISKLIAKVLLHLFVDIPWFGPMLCRGRVVFAVLGILTIAYTVAHRTDLCKDDMRVWCKLDDVIKTGLDTRIDHALSFLAFCSVGLVLMGMYLELSEMRKCNPPDKVVIQANAAPAIKAK